MQPLCHAWGVLRCVLQRCGAGLAIGSKSVGLPFNGGTVAKLEGAISNRGGSGFDSHCRHLPECFWYWLHSQSPWCLVAPRVCAVAQRVERLVGVFPLSNWGLGTAEKLPELQLRYAASPAGKLIRVGAIAPFAPMVALPAALLRWRRAVRNCQQVGSTGWAVAYGSSV